jgi:hypothetical protein
MKRTMMNTKAVRRRRQMANCLGKGQQQQQQWRQ